VRTLIISVNREEINMPTWPLGAALVASAVQAAGHEVELLDLMSVNDPQQALKTLIKKFRPGVIGLSVRNVDDQSMTDTKFLLDETRDLMSVLRSSTQAPIVLGGAGYSIFPGALLHYFGADMGIQGEGEKAFPALIERLEKGEDVSSVPGLFLRGKGLLRERVFADDLDTLPLPDNRFLPEPSIRNSDDFMMPVQTRRGCPMRCSYCSTGAIERCALRNRSPEKVAQWLKMIAGLGMRRYYLVDNTFNLPPSYAKALCREIIKAELDIVWRAIVYPVRIEDELAQLMSAAGCNEVALGFESGSEMVLQGMNKRFRHGDVKSACATLGKAGIRRMGFLLLGGPGETRESVLESLAFADSLHLECMKITVGIRIYPYTRLAEIAGAKGIISPEDDLLAPRFYVEAGLKDWLLETVGAWVSSRPNWVK
jgi:radical SAM superfamily enzyme YgiQ (UPF0313 family)